MVAKSLDKSKEAAAKNWRLSLNPAPLFEKIFSHLNFGGCKVKKVLKLIKDIKTVALEDKDRGIMKSYNVRQTLLWCAHERDHYTEDQLLLAILQKLSIFLKEGFLPSFLEEKRNLIFNLSQDQCKVGHHQLEEIIKRIEHWISSVHDCQQVQQRKLADLTSKLKVIPGVMQFTQPGFLAKRGAERIAEKFRTTAKNNEEQVFFDLRSLPKSDYGPQFRNNIEGLEYHLEKAVKALRVLLMEQNKAGEEEISGRLKEKPASVEDCEDKVNCCPLTTILNDDRTREENMFYAEENIEEFEKEAFFDMLSKMSVDQGDASLTCSLPNKEIISKSRQKVSAENIQVQGAVLKPAPLTLVGDGRLTPLALQADLSIELNVSLSLKVEILVKLLGSKVQLLPLLPVPESYAASLKGFGRVKLSVDLEVPNLQGDHARIGKPKTPTIVISFSDWEVDSLDLGVGKIARLNLAEVSSIVKDLLEKELGEQRCKWNTKQLEEKIQQILDDNSGQI